VLDRALPSHWEGDLILGVGSSAIGTLVERKTRFTLLLHLPPLPEHGPRPRAKNGPALAGHGAEMSQHARLRIDTGLNIYFCDPRSPWQRGTNENTNGLLRQ